MKNPSNFFVAYILWVMEKNQDPKDLVLFKPYNNQLYEKCKHIWRFFWKTTLLYSNNDQNLNRFYYILWVILWIILWVIVDLQKNIVLTYWWHFQAGRVYKFVSFSPRDFNYKLYKYINIKTAKLIIQNLQFVGQSTNNMWVTVNFWKFLFPRTLYIIIFNFHGIYVSLPLS